MESKKEASGKNSKISHLYAVSFFSSIALLANWKLVLLKASMKWDITNYTLPINIFISDSIRNGIFPLWNPLLNYGYPLYARIGIGLYYPSTLFFNLLGYNLLFIHIEYILHVILAGYFMFLLALYINRENKNRFFISLLSGVIYSFSGMFLSNAEHIMIIISISWIPLLFLFILRYIHSNNIKYLLFAGTVFGLIFIGGYITLFCLTTIFILPFVILESYFNGEDNIWKLVLTSLKTYFFVISFTILMSSVALMPFINSMNFITRVKLSYDAASFGSIVPTSIITMFIPNLSSKSEIIGIYNDISMVDMYSSVFLILTFSVIVLFKNLKTKIYLVLALFSLFFSFGRYFVLHPLFYSIVPLFDTFRFPSLTRIYFVFFCILALNYFLIDFNIYTNKLSIKKKFIESLFFLLTFMFNCCLIFLLLNPKISYFNIIIFGFIISIIFILCYNYLFYKILTTKEAVQQSTIGRKRKANRALDPKRSEIFSAKSNCGTASKVQKKIWISLVLVITIEVMIFHCFAFSSTIATEDPSFIQDITQTTTERTKSVDFKDNAYFLPPVDLGSNAYPLYQKIFVPYAFDSFKLKKAEGYKMNFNTTKDLNRPVVSFLSLSKLSPLNKSDLHTNISNYSNVNLKITKFNPNYLEINIDSNCPGLVLIKQINYPGWEAFLNGKQIDIIEYEEAFMAVKVEEGSSNIKFKFHPLDFYVGLSVTCGYLLFSLFYILLLQFYYYKKSKH